MPNPRQYNLPPSNHFSPGSSGASMSSDPLYSEIYAVSVTHQLHCLAMIRNTLIQYLREPDKEEKNMKGDHVMHCLDYSTFLIQFTHIFYIISALVYVM